MVVNHFKMRTDVLSHNLAGMGCSSGVIAIDMARHYLQVRNLSTPRSSWYEYTCCDPRYPLLQCCFKTWHVPYQWQLCVPVLIGFQA